VAAPNPSRLREIGAATESRHPTVIQACVCYSRLCLKTPKSILDTVSTGSGSDLISDQYAIFPQGFETRFVDQVAIAPVLTVSNHEI